MNFQHIDKNHNMNRLEARADTSFVTTKD